MTFKCNNPACDIKIDTNKPHIIRYDKQTNCKLYFCSDGCDMSMKFMFDKKERLGFHKIANVWKKKIEKDLRAFYDFMPETYFDFMKTEDIKEKIVE